MLISNVILKALKQIITILEKGKIEWCLFGGLAIQVYKRIRATKDIDIMIALSSEKVNELILRIERNGFFKLDKKTGIIKLNNFELFRFIYTDPHTTFEVFIDLATARSDFQKQILLRKTKADFLGIKVYVSSLEDTILLKLLANRPIDFLDAQYLIEENIEDLNRKYLYTWAKKLKVINKLRKIIK